MDNAVERLPNGNVRICFLTPLVEIHPSEAGKLALLLLQAAGFTITHEAMIALGFEAKPIMQVEEPPKGRMN